MPPKKKGKGHKEAKPPKAPETPAVVIIRPNVYEIIQRRLKREKAARTAAWLLYPDAPSYIKDLKLEDPVEKKKKLKTEAPTSRMPAPTPSGLLLLPLLPATGASLMGVAGMSEAEAAKAKKAIIFNFNMREFEIKPEEEAWIEGEPLGDSDSDDGHGSLRKFVTSQEELREFREKYLLVNKRRAALLASGIVDTIGQTSSKMKIGNVKQGVSKINSHTILNETSTTKLPVPDTKPSINLLPTPAVSTTKDIGKVKSSVNPPTG